MSQITNKWQLKSYFKNNENLVIRNNKKYLVGNASLFQPDTFYYCEWQSKIWLLNDMKLNDA